MSGSGSALIAEGLALAARADALVARRSGSVYNRAALLAWHAALANRDSAPARIVWMGDSITEGSSANAYGLRWIDRALASLRAAYPTAGVAGGLNYLPAIPATNLVTAVGAGVAGIDGTWGLGSKTSLFTVGAGVTYAVEASSVKVHYLNLPAGVQLRIAVDGGAPVTIALGGTFDQLTWSSGPLAPGPHTVNVTNAGGGTLYHMGLTAYLGDEAKGIQGHGAGQFGSSAGQLAGASGDSWAALGTVGPQLVTVAIGTNDYQAQTPVATYRAHLALIVASIRAVAPAASVALIMYARRGDLALQPIGWQAYVDAVYAAADADTGGLSGRSGVAVIDLSSRLPDAALTGAADPLGIIAPDRVHYSAKGHALIGEMVAGALRP